MLAPFRAPSAQPILEAAETAWYTLTEPTHAAWLRKAAESPNLAGYSETLLMGLGVDCAQQDAEKGMSFLESIGREVPGQWLLAQINPKPGDIEGNLQQHRQWLHTAESMKAELLIFPELSLLGYPIRDVITRHPWLVDQQLDALKQLAAEVKNCVSLVGFAEPRNARGRPFYNALAVLHRGQVIGIVRKCLLPTYSEYEDWRTFEPSNQVGIVDKSGLTTPSSLIQDGLLCLGENRIALSICEDLWSDEQFFSPCPYENNPIAELVAKQPTVLVNASASASRSRKEPLKHRLCRHVTQRWELPLVYVNQCGSVDECSFDGASRAYNAKGELIARGFAFQSQTLCLDPKALQSTANAGNILPLPAGLETTLTKPVKPPEQRIFNPHADYDLGRTYESLLQGIHNYFAKAGFERAVLGVSGGLDSAVVAVLLADALGGHNVFGMSFPTELTPDDNRSDGEQLIQALGAHWAEIPIGPMAHPALTGIEAERNRLNTAWGRPSEWSFAKDNVQAISRATLLRLLGNDYRALPIATSDKSEFYLGYTTVNGDMSGALAPIGDVPKTKVRALARWLNNNRPIKNVIPESVVTRPSGADLAINPATGKLLSAEEALMPYDFADEIIWRIEALQQGKADMMHSPFYLEGQQVISAEQKEAWIDTFYQRMQHAAFKWWIAPPTLLVSGNGSLTKTDYHHPIVSHVNPSSSSGKTY